MYTYIYIYITICIYIYMHVQSIHLDSDVMILSIDTQRSSHFHLQDALPSHLALVSAHEPHSS